MPRLKDLKLAKAVTLQLLYLSGVLLDLSRSWFDWRCQSRLLYNIGVDAVPDLLVLGELADYTDPHVPITGSFEDDPGRDFEAVRGHCNR
jgi:hypothetical protein